MGAQQEKQAMQQGVVKKDGSGRGMRESTIFSGGGGCPQGARGEGRGSH